MADITQILTDEYGDASDDEQQKTSTPAGTAPATTPPENTEAAQEGDLQTKVCFG